MHLPRTFFISKLGMVSTTGHEPKNGTCAIAALAAMIRIKYIRNISANGSWTKLKEYREADSREKVYKGIVQTFLWKD